VGDRQLDIRGRDLNPYGHVNSAVYATYLEECRNALIVELLDGVGAAGDFALAHIAIDYRRELTTADGHVIVHSWVERIGTSSVAFREEIRTADGELAADSEAVIVAHDHETGRSRPITGPERTAFEAGAEA
jgi:acyl-CoA thioester hydrolase